MPFTAGRKTLTLIREKFFRKYLQSVSSGSIFVLSINDKNNNTMKLNREQQSILYKGDNNQLDAVAAEYARMNQPGFTYGWTAEQHLERLNKQYNDLKSQIAAEQAEAAKKHSRTQPQVQGRQSASKMNYTEMILAGIDTGE